MQVAARGHHAHRLVDAVARDEVERGQVLAKPGSIQPHTKFEAEVYVLVGDGSYLMLHSELLTSIQEGYKINILLLETTDVV